MPTTEQYLNQLKTDKSNLVSNLITQGVEASSNETFTSLVPKVLDIHGTSTYSGFLPNNSEIFTTQKGQSSIKITIAGADSSSTGTRIYYQKNSYPDYNCSSYVDIENSNSYILNNLDPSTKYYFRCASYITQDGTKFFNNSKVIGSASSTYTFIIQDNVYIIAGPDDEEGTPYLYMSKYTGILYCLINFHFYKFNPSTADWTLIQDMTSLESKAFRTTNMIITHRGIFFGCDSNSAFNSYYTAWYDENNETFTILSISMRSICGYLELSNDDILFFGRYSDGAGSGTSSRQPLNVLKHNSNTLTTLKTNCYQVSVCDLDNEHIYIGCKYYDYGTYYYKLVYNSSTGNYDSSTSFGLPNMESEGSLFKTRNVNLGNGLIAILLPHSIDYSTTLSGTAPGTYTASLFNTNTGIMRKGPTLKPLSNIPCECPLAILNGNIYYVNSNKLYSWDYEAGTGTIVDNNISVYAGMYKYNNKLYMVGSAGIYEFDGTSLTLSYSASLSGECIFYEVSDGLIFANSSQRVLKLSNSTWTSMFTPNTNYYGQCGYLLDLDNNLVGIKVYNGQSGYRKINFIIKDKTTTNITDSDFSKYIFAESLDDNNYIIYGYVSATAKQILINKSDTTYTEGYSLGYNPGLYNSTTKYFYNLTDKVLYGLNEILLTLPAESTITNAGGTNPDIDFTYFRNSSTSAGSQILVVNGPTIQV